MLRGRHAAASLLRLATTEGSRTFASQGTSSGTTSFGFREVNVDEKETLVGKVFSNVAPSYDIMNDVMSAGVHRYWKNRFVSMLHPFPGMQHLDVAGGTGDIAFRILNSMKAAGSGKIDGRVTVLDINASMVEEGRKKAAKLGLEGPHLDWAVDSAETLPFADESLDSYTVAFGIRNVTHRDIALSEAYRVLKRGGRFMCLEFSKVDTPILKEYYEAYSMNVIPKLGKLVANDEDSYQYLVESIRRFPDGDAFADEIQDAEFRFVDYEKLTGGVVAIHSGFKP